MERIRILVADDSTPIQKVIKIAFSKSAVEIDCVGSLVEGAGAVKRSKPDLVIFDAGLPGAQSSKDFVDFVQDVPSIALLGSYETISKDDLAMSGFRHILKKPFDSKDLISLAEKLVPGFKPVQTSIPPQPLAAATPPVPPSPKVPLPPPPAPSFAPPPPVPKAAATHMDEPSFTAAMQQKIEAYCRDHFAEIARKVITDELRRLADEKTRHLTS